MTRALVLFSLVDSLVRRKLMGNPPYSKVSVFRLIGLDSISTLY
nr:MAG TPA: hypothetical protein [Caudoviricetes sp.]